MRILYVARFLQAINQKKLAQLGRLPEVALWHLAPERWQDSFNAYHIASADHGSYQQVAWPVRGAPDIHRFIYWPPPAWIRKLQPDIIHLDEEPDSLAALEFCALRACLAPRAKLVIFTWQNIDRPRRPLVRLLTRITLGQTDGLLCGNREAAEVVRRLGFRGPTAVIPQLGLDPADFAPEAATAALRAARPFTIGYVGRLTADKGVDVLIEAVQPLAETHLQLIGQGPLWKELTALQARPEWQGRLLLTGSRTHLEVARLLPALDVLVLPSRTRPLWKEQFGHVLIEAMAAEVPIIGSDSGAIPEVVGEAGLIVPEGNAEALRAAIQTLKSDPGRRAELAARGRARVNAHYTHATLIAQTLAFYRQLTPGV